MNQGYAMSDYKINESGRVVLNDVQIIKTSQGKIAQNNELKKYLNIKKIDNAKEKIKQKLILSDTSNDKIATFTAITQFKKTNE